MAVMVFNMRYLFVILLLTSTAFADVDIPVRYQVKNKPPGACQWMSLECMGTFLGYGEFSGLGDWYIERNRSAGNINDAKRQLEAWKVPYRTGSTLGFIKQQTDRGLPVLIGFHRRSYYGDGIYGHAAVVVNVTKSKVEFIESNSTGHVYSYSLAEFPSQWDGTALVIDKE